MLSLIASSGKENNSQVSYDSHNSHNIVNNNLKCNNFNDKYKNEQVLNWLENSEVIIEQTPDEFMLAQDNVLSSKNCHDNNNNINIVIDIPSDDKIKMHSIYETKTNIHSIVDDIIVMENREPHFNLELNSDDIFKGKNKFFDKQETNIAMEIIEENEPIECKIVQCSVEDYFNTEVNSHDIFQDKNVSFIEQEPNMEI